MPKKRVYLTHITLHVREHRQTLSFSKAAEKGRMYSPVPKDYLKTIDHQTGRFEIATTLPEDLQKQIDNDEVEIMMPKGEFPIVAGNDMIEKIKQKDKLERIQLIHRNRKNFFRP